MDSGERCPIFLREGRFAALESGTGIDYVLVRPETPVAKAEVIPGRAGARRASAHCALVVELSTGMGH